MTGPKVKSLENPRLSTKKYRRTRAYTEEENRIILITTFKKSKESQVRKGTDDTRGTTETDRDTTRNREESPEVSRPPRTRRTGESPHRLGTGVSTDRLGKEHVLLRRTEVTETSPSDTPFCDYKSRSGVTRPP